MLLGALMAAPTLGEELAVGGLPYVLDSVLGSFWGGKVLLCDVAVAIFICTLAIQTACSRLMFSMARDGRLPFSAQLSHVNSRTGTPDRAVDPHRRALHRHPAGQCGQLRDLRHPRQRLHHPDLPGLPRRDRADALPPPPGLAAPGGGVDAGGRKLFSLGRFGIVVNALAVLYGGLMVINLAWPPRRGLRPPPARCRSCAGPDRSASPSPYSSASRVSHAARNIRSPSRSPPPAPRRLRRKSATHQVRCLR